MQFKRSRYSQELRNGNFALPNEFISHSISLKFSLIYLLIYAKIPKWSLSFMFSEQNFVHISHLSPACHMLLHPFYHHSFDHPNILQNVSQQNTVRAPNGHYSFSWNSTHSIHGILNGVNHSIQIHTGIVLQSNSNFKAYC
jgi:hypothetical protein